MNNTYLVYIREYRYSVNRDCYVMIGNPDPSIITDDFASACNLYANACKSVRGNYMVTLEEDFGTWSEEVTGFSYKTFDGVIYSY